MESDNNNYSPLEFSCDCIHSEPTALHRKFTMIDYCIVTVRVCAFYIIIITKFLCCVV